MAAVRINIPPVTRVLLGAMLLQSFLYTAGRYHRMPGVSDPRSNTEIPLIPYLTLVPKLFLYYPWTFVTASLVERTLIALLVNTANIFFGGKYLERAWGSREFSKVLLVSALIPNALAVLVYWIWASFTTYKAYTPISGGVALQAAFLVAFKQLVPEHTVSLFKNFVRIRVKHFPAIFLLLNTISGLVFGTHTALQLAWLGLLTSWTYLRFFKRQPPLSLGTSTSSTPLRGDASETFSFATFFPDVIQPPIASVCESIYTLLTSLQILTPFSTEAIESSNLAAQARSETGLPHLLGRSGRGTGRREEAERRRALALQALDQRLSAAHSNPNASANKPAVVPQAVNVQPAKVTPSLEREKDGGGEVLGGTDYVVDEGS